MALTKEQKQNMKKRIEKALDVLHSDSFCGDINCDDCPLSPNCLKVIAINNLQQAINDIGEQPKTRYPKVKEDKKEELNKNKKR